jgi:ABC-type multidrug transport system fused ATPase/permease subunit
VINTFSGLNMKDNKPFTLFLRYADRHKRSIYGLTLVYIVSTVLLVLAPQTLSRFIDSAHGGGGWRGPTLAILLYLAAMLAHRAQALQWMDRIMIMEKGVLTTPEDKERIV